MGGMRAGNVESLLPSFALVTEHLSALQRKFMTMSLKLCFEEVMEETSGKASRIISISLFEHPSCSNTKETNLLHCSMSFRTLLIC